MPAPPAAAVASASSALSTAMRALWRLRWDNHHKETLWRLSVGGVPAAGGNNIVLRGPCPCGWALPEASEEPPATDAAMLCQAHVFWECPIAAAVRATLSSALPPSTPLPCAAVWLLRPPTGCTLHAGVWSVVCAAAIEAMHWGRRYLWAKTHESSPPVDVTQRLITDFFSPAELPSDGHHQTSDGGVLHQASRLAVSHFWSSLLDFTSLYSSFPPNEKEWLPLPGPSHPFICTVGTGADIRLHLNLPPGVAWVA